MIKKIIPFLCFILFHIFCEQIRKYTSKIGKMIFFYSKAFFDLIASLKLPIFQNTDSSAESNMLTFIHYTLHRKDNTFMSKFFSCWCAIQYLNLLIFIAVGFFSDQNVIPKKNLSKI